MAKSKKIEPGARVHAPFSWGTSAFENRLGTVVYIHPLRRFYTVEFELKRMNGVTERVRECFWFPDSTVGVIRD